MEGGREGGNKGKEREEKGKGRMGWRDETKEWKKKGRKPTGRKEKENVDKNEGMRKKRKL